MTDSRDLTPGERRWMALADELTPAKSLARLDAAGARVVSTIGVVATLLTGFGLVAAGLPEVGDRLRLLAVGSVVLAVAAVGCAVAAQVVSITRDLNTGNLAEVEDWYRRRFEVRAPLTRWASLLLLLAVAVAGVVAVTALLRPAADDPALTLTRTLELSPEVPPEAAPATVTVDVRFGGLEAGEHASLSVAVGAVVVSQAALPPDADGIAARTVTVAHVAPDATVTVRAAGGGRTCGGTSVPGEPIRLTC